MQLRSAVEYVHIYIQRISTTLFLVQELDSGCFGMADVADVASVDCSLLPAVYYDVESEP